MKTHFKAAAALMFTVTACVFIFKNSTELAEGISHGLTLCASSVVPSLFPFMVLSDFIVKSGVSKLLGGVIFKPVGQLLKLSDNGCTVLFVSLVGGYPIGPKMTAELLKENKISQAEARRLNLFCINPSPAFVITMLGEVFFGSEMLGIIFYASCVISSLIIALCSSFSADNKNAEGSGIFRIDNPVDALVSSAYSGTVSMLLICAWVVIFNAVVSVILCYFKGKGAFYVCSVLEITNGINLVKKILPFWMSAFLIAFGGVSVHCQVLSDIRKSKMKIWAFAASRLAHALLSGAVCFVLLKLFPVNLDVFSNYASLTADSYSVSLPAAAALIAMCVLLIFEVDTNRKMC